MGKGFAFVERQKLVRTETEDFYIDLVFYNFILKCFVLVDLKMNTLTHRDVGQMDFYVRMFDDIYKKEDDNPVYQKYRGIYAKKAMNAKRNSDIDSVQEQYEKWKKETSKFLDDIEKGTKTYEQFDKWLDKNN